MASRCSRVFDVVVVGNGGLTRSRNERAPRAPHKRKVIGMGVPNGVPFATPLKSAAVAEWPAVRRLLTNAATWAGRVTEREWLSTIGHKSQPTPNGGTRMDTDLTTPATRMKAAR